MDKANRTETPVSRRDLLEKAAVIGAGMASVAALSGCAPSDDQADLKASVEALQAGVDEMNAMLDEQESMLAIKNLIAQYAVSMDRCDPELGYVCAWDDANFYYTNGDYNYFDDTSRAFVDWSMDLHLNSFLATTHDMVAEWITVKGDKAVSETRGLIYILWPAGETPTGKTTQNPYMAHHQNRYIDYWERRDGEWRVAKRYCGGDTSCYFTESGVDCVSYDSPRGENRTQDKLYEFLALLDD